MEDAKSSPSIISSGPAHPFTTRALGDEEAGTDIGRGGHKMSTGWEEQGSGGEALGVMKDGRGVGWSAADRYRSRDDGGGQRWGIRIEGWQRKEGYMIGGSVNLPSDCAASQRRGVDAETR